MTDRKLDELLHTLPRETAPESFTGRVLDSLPSPGAAEARPAARWRAGPLAGLALAAGLLVAAALGVLLVWQVTERAELARLVQELRYEQGRLSDELKDLRQQLRQVRPVLPVLYMGGDDRADYVLDLRNLARLVLEAREQSVSARPGRRSPHVLPRTGGSL